jgi:predicted kinase
MQVEPAAHAIRWLSLVGATLLDGSNDSYLIQRKLDADGASACVPSLANGEVIVSRPLLIVVGGPPGSGKTTLATDLARSLRIPVISRDGIKEPIMEVYRIDTVEQSRQAGQAAYRVLGQLIEQMVISETSCVVESNFGRGKGEDDFAPFLGRATIIQVHCSAPNQVILERFRDRAGSGERHPGHQDLEVIDDLAVALDSGRYEPLNLKAPLYRVDTTEGFDPTAEDIVARIREITE